MKPGDPVRLHTPENTRLHGALASILTLTPYGAEVATEAAGSGRFRALASEMRPVLETASVPGGNGQAREQGYTGDCCDQCGSCCLKRNGACLLCEECGSTSGCS